MREVKLLDPALEAIEAQKEHSLLSGGRIFTNPITRKPWNDDTAIMRHWQSVLDKTGVRYRNPYQTRHTYASLLLSAGKNPMWVASQMGHADWGMIRKRYGRWIPSVDPSVGEKANRIAPKIAPDGDNMVTNEKYENKKGKLMVPKAGLEPARVSPHAPQTCVSTIPPLRHCPAICGSGRKTS